MTDRWKWTFAAGLFLLGVGFSAWQGHLEGVNEGLREAASSRSDKAAPSLVYGGPGVVAGGALIATDYCYSSFVVGATDYLSETKVNKRAFCQLRRGNVTFQWDARDDGTCYLADAKDTIDHYGGLGR